MSGLWDNWNKESPEIGGKSTAEGASDRQRLEWLAKSQFEWLYNQTIPLINLVVIVMGWFSVSIEVFLRHSFGERYFSLVRFLLGYFTLAITLQAAQFGAVWGGDVNGFLARMSALGSYGLLQVVYWGYILISLIHLVRTFRRNRKGERWHSWSFGVSWFSPLIGRTVPFINWRIDEWGLYRIIEPGVIAAAAFVLNRPLPAFAGWLWVAAFTLFIKNNYLYSQARGVMLDVQDREIEAQFLEQALRGDDQRKTQGFVLVRPPAGIDRNRKPAPAEAGGIPDAMQRLAASPPPVSSARPDYRADLDEVLAGNPPPADEPPLTSTPPAQPDYSSDLANIMGEQPKKPASETGKDGTL